MSNALDLFDPTCPEGAKWYACEATAANKSPFVGCCTTDPCSVRGCALGNLAPVSFNASAYGTVPDPSCGAASTFYTCVNMPKNDTTFWGCCKSNPCNKPETPDDKSCPKADLTPALLDNANLQAAYGASNATESAAAEHDGTHSNTGVIVGGAVGGGVAIVAIIAILVFCLMKRRKARSRPSSASAQTGFPPPPEKTDYRHSTHDEAPPTYSSPQPNNFSLSPSAAFGQYQYQQVAQTQPQELPADFTQGPTQRYSELPAEATSMQLSPQPAAELESPEPSPALASRAAFSPMSSPSPLSPRK